MSRKISRRTRRGCTTILLRLLIHEASAFMVFIFAFGAQTWMSSHTASALWTILVVALLGPSWAWDCRM
ncbi:MAG: hypothetical protein ACM3ZC_13835 [Bacteroidota bacterium]